MTLPRHHLAFSLFLVGGLPPLTTACGTDSPANDSSTPDGDDDDGQGDDDDGATGETSEPATGEGVELDAVQHLVRVSMALRGVRPSVAEIEAVAADPAALPGIVDGYLESDRFGETIRDMHNEALLSLADYFIYPAGFQPVAELEGEDLYRLNRDVMEAPDRKSVV